MESNSGEYVEMKLDEENLTVDVWGGVIPNEEILVKIYCKESAIGLEQQKQILDNQNIVDSVRLILETALDQRKRLILLLTDENPHRDISQKEFDRVCIIIDHLRPMWKYNTGKDIEELS